MEESLTIRPLGAGKASGLARPLTLCFGLATTLLSASCTPTSSPLTLEVTVDSVPRVGEVLTYRASLSAIGRDVPNITLQVELPQSIEVLAGTPGWEGDLAAGETTVLELRLRVVQQGQWLIQTSALAKPNPASSATLGASDRILLISEPDSGRIVTNDELQGTELPCGPDLSCGSPPAPSTKPLVTLTPSP